MTNPSNDKSGGDRMLEISHRMNELSVQRGRLLARLRPITNELANLRKELEKLIRENNL